MNVHFLLGAFHGSVFYPHAKMERDSTRRRVSSRACHLSSAIFAETASRVLGNDYQWLFIQ